MFSLPCSPATWKARACRETPSCPCPTRIRAPGVQFLGGRVTGGFFDRLAFFRKLGCGILHGTGHAKPPEVFSRGPGQDFRCRALAETRRTVAKNTIERDSGQPDDPGRVCLGCGCSYVNGFIYVSCGITVHYVGAVRRLRARVLACIFGVLKARGAVYVQRGLRPGR